MAVRYAYRSGIGKCTQLAKKGCQSSPLSGSRRSAAQSQKRMAPSSPHAASRRPSGVNWSESGSSGSHRTARTSFSAGTDHTDSYQLLWATTRCRLSGPNATARGEMSLRLRVPSKSIRYAKQPPGWFTLTARTRAPPIENA